MTILDELRKLSSAEEIFSLLDVPYQPELLRVARLHILRRMGDYLRKEPLASLSEEELREQCRGYLISAYADFVKSSPLEERVFKVLKDAVKPKSSGAFVSLESLSLSKD
jgi:nitrogenase-stabilizing/protective protein